MSLQALLDYWKVASNVAPNIVVWRTTPSQIAQTQPFPPELHPKLVIHLKKQGIESLYTHQRTTWDYIQAGHHPVIATSTASGKTLSYNLPILHHLFHNPDTRALYLFPTKALAQDQATTLRQFLDTPAQVATYDGDTPSSLRPKIRKQARLLITNPDMLHTGILPHHPRWVEFFQNLRFVVIDELHTYRGVFGSHVANVLRRLKRIASFYGAAPQFILTSATIANPIELSERLIELPTALVDNDGAAKGSRHFLIYNPPIINEEFGLRRSLLQESVHLSQDLLNHNLQTIIFGRARRTVELLLNYIRADVGNDVAKTIRAYRSGYLPQQRREIEQDLRSGRVRTVVATRALELGINIGGMDAVMVAGYPGTIAGLWQQIGRAGREQSEALALLITSASPLDQFLAQHPNYLFERSPEQGLIAPDNLLILLQHLRCAAFELPFRANEKFGNVELELTQEFLQFLAETGELHQSDEQFFWMADQYPAQNVSLRSASPERVHLVIQANDDTYQTIGEVDQASASWMVHPQAIYLHEGSSFVVEQLDLEANIARLRPHTSDYYTEPKREVTVELLERLRGNEVVGAQKTYGEILVTSQVVGYHAIRWFTQERVGEGEVTLPPTELQTTGYWLTLNDTTVDYLREQGLWGGDPNDYGPNWSKRRNQARARDNYCCQICGTPEQGRQHDVHHKVPFRMFETYEQANQLANLVTLCRPCHRRAETAVRVRSGLSGLATTLGHLAPFLLMCDPHDIAVHADPASPLAEGKPTILIYDAIPAGLGFSERLFTYHNHLIQQAYALVADCPCPEGCPSCVGPAGPDGRGGKQETLVILGQLTNG